MNKDYKYTSLTIYYCCSPAFPRPFAFLLIFQGFSTRKIHSLLVDPNRELLKVYFGSLTLGHFVFFSLRALTQRPLLPIDSQLLLDQCS